MPKLRDKRGLFSGLGLPATWLPWRVVPSLQSAAFSVLAMSMGRDDHQFTVARGLPEAVSCPLQTWLRHGPAIVAVLPVRRVELLDRHPDWRPLVSQPGGMHFWYRSPVDGPLDETDLPPAIFDRLNPDTTDKDGDDEFRGHYAIGRRHVSEAVWVDLSRAMVEWARDEARRLGLAPPLQAG